MSNPKPPAALIGFGRFGRVLSDILRPEFQLAVHDADRANLDQAARLDFQTVSLAEAASRSVVFLAVPISQMEPLLKQIAPHVKPGALVVDHCSVKVVPAQLMQEHLPESAHILATHPLFGPDSAKGGVDGLHLVLCPVRLPEPKLVYWRNFWKSRGVHVIECTPEQHDRQSAYTMGVTHFVGRVLGDMDLHPTDISTKGFESLLRVVEHTTNDTWELFHDMQHYNPYAKHMRDDLVKALRSIETKLDQAINN